MKPRTAPSLAFATLLLATGCGGEPRTAEDEATMAGVMCEDPVRAELDLPESAEFDTSPEVEVSSDESPWSYQVSGAVAVDGRSTEYVCTISTDDEGDSWTVEELEVAG